MPTPEATRMAGVVGSCAPVLKRAGFRKRRHSFNRRTSAGLVHVVTLWMHPKEPPAWTEVPGLRERGYGTFRLDVGVHVPEMTRSHTPRSSWVNDYDCHLRRTAGQLAGDELGDRWWPLSDPDADAWALSALESLALPWLDRFPDHDAIVETFRAEGPLPIGMSPAAPLDVAEMLVALGRPAEARTVLEQYVGRPVVPAHARYLAEYLPRIGHADLVPRVVAQEPDHT